MDDLQSKLGAIMNDPDMMQKIMSMAQSLGESTPQQDAPPPEIDLGLLQKLTGFAGQSRIEPKEQNLLHALGPYLSHRRLSRLERAMRAAKMAAMATALLPMLSQGR